MRMPLSGKGVSPIVSVILIILIAVAGTVVLFSWLHGTATSDQGVSDAGSQRLAIKGVQFNDNNTITVYVQNIGEATAQIDTVYLVDDNGNIVYKWDVSARVGSGETARLVLPNPPVSMEQGRTYRILIGGASSTATYALTPADTVYGCLQPGWTYYRVVNIFNPTSISVSNFPVRVELDNGNFDFTHANPDGSDIRFYSSDCQTQLYYWIEYWNTTMGRAVLWVEVPSLPAGDTVSVVMMYGNPSASFDAVYYDPEQIFIFFENAETFTGWVVIGSGNLYQTTQQVLEGSYSILKDDYCDTNGGKKSLPITLGGSQAFAVEAYMYRNTTNTGDCLYYTNCYADRIGVLDNSNNGYGFAVNHPNTANPSIQIDKRTSLAVTTLGTQDIPVDQCGVWYEARLYWFPDGTLTVSAYMLNGTRLGVVSSTDTSYNSFDYVYIMGGRPYYIDLIKVRPLLNDPANPEPSVVVGPELP